MSRYAISDIHGCLKTFRALLFDRLNLSRQDELFLLGDYIDRGPDSKGVLDLVMALRADGYHIEALRGNHDEMFYRLGLTYDPTERDNWEIYGGTETLVSFGAFETGFQSIPRRYFELIGDMPYYCETEGYVLVHAGLNMRLDDIFEDHLAMLWSRGWYEHLRPERLDGRVLVHGHTPMRRSEIERQVEKLPLPVINIDCGCVYHGVEGKGVLCALDLDRRELCFQENVDGEGYLE